MRASLQRAINWIAYNDEPAECDGTVIAELVSVALVADVWGKDTTDIALRVLRARKTIDQIVAVNAANAAQQ